MRTIELYAMPGAMPSSLAITADVLATANRLRLARGRPPAFDLRVRGPAARAARTFLFAALPELSASDDNRADVLIIPSMVTVTEEAVHARLLQRDAVRMRRELIEAAEHGVHIAASCSAVFHVARAGLLDNRRATTTWWLAPAFRRMFPKVELDADEMVVSDGRFSTAGAAMAHLDLMLSLVDRYCGSDMASRCARFLLLDGRRSQARYMAMGQLAGQDPNIARAERWARAELERGVTVEALAAKAEMSPRTFARRIAQATGLSPVQFLRRLRVERAVELLETTSLSVEVIAHRVGYSEPTTLRRLLKREAGARPRELRPG